LVWLVWWGEVGLGKARLAWSGVVRWGWARFGTAGEVWLVGLGEVRRGMVR
jgi:hypothetical protein